MHIRNGRFVAAILLAGAVLTACGSDATETEGPEPSGAEACTADLVGGEVTFATLSHAAGLDPVVNTGTGGSGGIEAIALYDTLVRYDTDTDSFVPMVAESLEPNAEFTEWTLVLRDGVTFGNGDPLTAQQVKDSIARHQSPESRSVDALASQSITDMKIVDDKTLVFTLDGPWSRFPSLLANMAGMITNSAVVEQQGENFNLDMTGGGVGPYEVKTYTPGEELVLSAKQDWWGGPVCIQELRFTVPNDVPAAYEAMQNGDVQMAVMRGPEIIEKVKADGVSGLSLLDNAGYTIIVNHADGRDTADLLVRQALAAALDPKVIFERGYNAEGRAGTAIIDPASPLYDGLEGPTPNADEAAELVAEAKANGWDGELDVPCQASTEANNVCLTYKALAEAAGMKLNIIPLEPNDFITRVHVDRDFDFANWSMPVADAEPWLRLSAAVGTDGARNAGSYSNPDMDAALADLKGAPDDEARLAALAEVQQVWNETLPLLVSGANEFYIAHDESIKGLQSSQYAGVYFDTAFIDG